MSCRESASTS